MLFRSGNGIYAGHIRQELQLDGPQTQRILLKKDIVSDARPPRLFLRSYQLVVYQMQDVRDAQELERISGERAKIQEDFNESYDKWNAQLPPGTVKNALQALFQTGKAYIVAVENEYYPLRRAGNLVAAHTVLEERINPLYLKNKEAANSFVALVRQEEQDTQEQVQKIVVEQGRISLWILVGTSTVLLVVATWLVRSIGKALGASVGTLSSTAAELASTVQQQELTSMSQSASVHETTTTMDELEASFRQTAELVKFAAQTARQSQDTAHRGVASVRQTISGMEGVRIRVADIATHILSLSQLTGQIGTISGLVGELASQTNMLAINAAVEAARAGEHGRGFAVVANEIRKLADESRRSAERIANLVEQIQRETSSTVLVTEEGSKSVEKGIYQVQELTKAFEDVATASQEASDSAHQTLLTVPQQVAAVQQVLVAMESLNAGAQEATAGLTLTRRGIERLRTTADNLKSLV